MRPVPAILPLQIRGAGAMRNCTQEDLVVRSGISKRSIAALDLDERGLRPDNVGTLVHSLEVGGIEFHRTKEGYP